MTAPHTMKTLCVTGLNPLAVNRIFQSLQQAGVHPAHPSGRDTTLNLNLWHDQAMSLIDIGQPEHISPRTGRFLEHIADDIFAANLGQALWGWEDTRSLWLLDFWLDFDPRIQFVLITTSPQQMLAQTLLTDRATLSADQVLEHWHTAHQTLLRFHLRHPDRSLLVQDEPCLAYPEAFLERCEQQWQIALPLSGPYSRPRLPQNSVALHLAQERCNAHPDVRSLNLELAATVLPLGEAIAPDTQDDAPSILDGFQQLWWQAAETAEALDIQRHLANERLDQLDAMTRETGALEQQKTELTAARDEQARLAGERQAELEGLSRKLRDTEQENELLLLQLHQVQEELENYFLKQQEAQRQLDEMAKLASERQAQIEQVSKARDEQAKLAGERQAELEGLSRKLKDTEQENELLLLQLHQVQEELENYFLKHQDAQQQLQTLRNVEERFTRMQQRVPDYCGFGGVELDQPEKATDVSRLNWRLLQLDIMGRYFPRFECDTLVEHGVAGIILPRHSGDSTVLVRWPLQAQQDNTVLIIPVCSQNNASQRMELLADLSTTDWQFLKTLSRQLAFIVGLPHTQQTLAELTAQPQTSAFQKLVEILQQFQPVFRYDQVSLQAEQPPTATDQASLLLRFDQPSFGSTHWPGFTIKLSRHPNHPTSKPGMVLTIPGNEAQPVLAEWFARHEGAESLNIPVEPDTHPIAAVWQELSARENPFVASLIKRLPAVLRTLESSGIETSSAWADWIDLVETAWRAIVSHSKVPAPAPAVPVQNASREGSVSPRSSRTGKR